jgi:hypothetical protein
MEEQTMPGQGVQVQAPLATAWSKVPGQQAEFQQEKSQAT